MDTFMDVKLPGGNSILAEAEIKGTKLILGSIYLPTRGKDGQFEEETAALSASLETIMKDRPVIMGGDINCDVDSSARRIADWQCFTADNDLTDHQMGHVTHRHHIWGNENEIQVSGPRISKWAHLFLN